MVRAPAVAVPPSRDVTRVSRVGSCAHARRIGVALTLIAATGALTTTGCRITNTSPAPGAPSPADAPPAAAAAADPSVDYRNADVVCDAFTRALLSIDTTTDPSPDDALPRAAPYVTGPMLATPHALPNGIRWQQWADHQARTEVTTSTYAGDAVQANGPVRTARLAQVTPVGRDGWRGQTQRYVVYCDLEPHGAQQLRVSAYTVEPLGD